MRDATHDDVCCFQQEWNTRIAPEEELRLTEELKEAKVLNVNYM